MISSIQFEPGDGKFCLSASYDGKCKVWNTRDWVEVRTLGGEMSRLTSASISLDRERIITTSFDRTFKVW